MKILHLSDTTLSGSPIRIVDLINKYSNHQATHIVWDEKTGFRTFKTDLVGPRLSREEIVDLFDWADVVHYHNRWKRQKIFSTHHLEPPKKPSVIQVHSPRETEGFQEEEKSGIPIAVIAQYHVRQWPTASYIVPNVVDIYDSEYQREPIPDRKIPVVSYAPSNCNSKGWDDKGYSVVAPFLKRLHLNNVIYFQLINQKPHSTAMALKRGADIGIDEVVTGSYHLSSLEYLSLGVPCFGNIDPQTKKVIQDLTGAAELPWIAADRNNFQSVLMKIVRDKSWHHLGAASRAWMEKYWNPEFLVGQYIEMYEDLPHS